MELRMLPAAGFNAPRRPGDGFGEAIKQRLHACPPHACDQSAGLSIRGAAGETWHPISMPIYSCGRGGSDMAKACAASDENS